MPRITKDELTIWLLGGWSVNPITKYAISIIDCWKLFFPDSVVNEIVVYTNKYFDKIRKKYQRQSIIPDAN